VVSDISMPNLDGEQLAARLAESDPELPVVLMSGNRVPDASFRGRRRAFIAKPMDRAALREAIEQVRADA
jgi:FixJ family two-component response regulator